MNTRSMDSKYVNALLPEGLLRLGPEETITVAYNRTEPLVCRITADNRLVGPKYAPALNADQLAVVNSIRLADGQALLKEEVAAFIDSEAKPYKKRKRVNEAVKALNAVAFFDPHQPYDAIVSEQKQPPLLRLVRPITIIDERSSNQSDAYLRKEFAHFTAAEEPTPAFNFAAETERHKCPDLRVLYSAGAAALRANVVGLRAMYGLSIRYGEELGYLRKTLLPLRGGQRLSYDNLFSPDARPRLAGPIETAGILQVQPQSFVTLNSFALGQITNFANQTMR